MYVNYGNEEQNDLMEQTGNNIEEEEEMDVSYIQKLMNEVEIYKQAIQNAKDALASAEMELDEVLAETFKDQ